MPHDSPIHRCVVKSKDVLSCKLLINGLWINKNITQYDPNPVSVY